MHAWQTGMVQCARMINLAAVFSHSCAATHMSAPQQGIDA
jgi:hypothetical protein